MKILLKPVRWNPEGYERPAGAPATPQSYPGINGFGHEEWNNAPALRVAIGRQPMRAFHTEPAGAVGPEDSIVFMYASHGRQQYLVGAAARARNLSNDDAMRRALRRLTHLEGFWKDAWALPSVRERFKNSKPSFRDHWAENVIHMPRWLAPETHWWWPSTPVPINPKAVTGKSKLNTRFTSYTELDVAEAIRLLQQASPERRGPAWHAVRSELQGGDRALTEDLLQIEEDNTSPATKRRLIDARLGQGRFRDEVLALWNGECAVTRCSVKEALRASHVKAWSDCTTRQERLDASNGLPLVASLDALFDRHLITFEPETGAMLVAPRLLVRDRRALGIHNEGLSRKPTPEQRRYLEMHRRAFRRLHEF